MGRNFWPTLYNFVRRKTLRWILFILHCTLYKFQRINSYNFARRKRIFTLNCVYFKIEWQIVKWNIRISSGKVIKLYWIAHLASHLSSTTRKAPISRFEIAADTRAWTRTSHTWALSPSPTPSLLPTLFPASWAHPWTVPKNWTGSRACPAPPTVNHIITEQSGSNH